MREHVGRIRAAAQQHGIPPEEWLDLSTGIAPDAYPVPPVPAECWQRLPEEDDGLEDAARAYYGSGRLLALPGSQAAIQLLPTLRPPGRAAVLAPTYAEHPAAWEEAGHRLLRFAAGDLERVAAEVDTVVLASPNNPDGLAFAPERLEALARRLAPRGGWLVVDEAFADAGGRRTLAAAAGGPGLENLIVLRSLGKFFGLAGARVGFAFAAPVVLDRLQEALGPWAVAGPARWAARHALADAAWQSAQRERLRGASERLACLLREAGLGEAAGTALFRYLPVPRAAEMFDALARQGILVRLFERPAALRFGLPGREADWQRLARALREL